jgi:hypothetical protein
MTLFAMMGASTSNSVRSFSCAWNFYMRVRGKKFETVRV